MLKSQQSNALWKHQSVIVSSSNKNEDDDLGNLLDDDDYDDSELITDFTEQRP